MTGSHNYHELSTAADLGSSFSLTGEEKGCRGIIAAMLIDAVKEASKLFRAGLWEKDPCELEELTQAEIRNTRPALRGSITNEIHFWAQNGAEKLLALVEMFLGVTVGRRDLILAAKRLSRDNPRNGHNKMFI